MKLSTLAFITLFVPSSVTFAADTPLKFSDPEPKRYEFTARASVIDGSL